MRIARIKNKYMYKCKDKYEEDNHHHYLIFYDRKNKRYNALQLTHIYLLDEKRDIQEKKGLILKEKFKEFEVPSGVKRQLYTTNVYGKNINLNSKYIEEIFPRHLSKKQSDRIKHFALNGKKKK